LSWLGTRSGMAPAEQRLLRQSAPRLQDSVNRLVVNEKSRAPAARHGYDGASRLGSAASSLTASDGQRTHAVSAALSLIGQGLGLALIGQWNQPLTQAPQALAASRHEAQRPLRRSQGVGEPTGAVLADRAIATGPSCFFGVAAPLAAVRSQARGGARR
jgi:hypothetical protein